MVRKQAGYTGSVAGRMMSLSLTQFLVVVTQFAAMATVSSAANRTINLGLVMIA